jgi:hypothetical protein
MARTMLNIASTLHQQDRGLKEDESRQLSLRSERRNANSETRIVSVSHATYLIDITKADMSV